MSRNAPRLTDRQYDALHGMVALALLGNFHATASYDAALVGALCVKGYLMTAGPGASGAVAFQFTDRAWALVREDDTARTKIKRQRQWAWDEGIDALGEVADHALGCRDR